MISLSCTDHLPVYPLQGSVCLSPFNIFGVIVGFIFGWVLWLLYALALYFYVNIICKYRKYVNIFISSIGYLNFRMSFFCHAKLFCLMSPICLFLVMLLSIWVVSNYWRHLCLESYCVQLRLFSMCYLDSILTLKFKFIWINICNWSEIWFLFLIFACVYWVFHHLLEFFLALPTSSFVMIWWSGIQTFLSLDFYSIGLSVFIPVLHCFNCYNFIV